MQKRLSEILFVVVLLSVAAYYNYQEIAFKRPQSTHKWRQSDCTSLALNYYQRGMKFNQPKTHNLTSDYGTTGFNATSEVPIFYYSVAMLYHFFGYHDAVYRIFNTLLFFLGLFYLFKTFNLFLNKTFWSISLTLFVFSSPLLVFYGNNFLTNSSALAFSIIGWYYFFLFAKFKSNKWFLISMTAFLIAASLKITALFSIFAILGIYFSEYIGISLAFNKNIFQRKFLFLIPLLIILIITGSWVVYADQYNSLHQTTYFSTTIFPIWDLNTIEINEVFHNVKSIWLGHYFHISALSFLALASSLWVLLFKKANKIIWYSTLFISLQLIVYVALQFWTFADHDYYTINMFILPILLVIGLFDVVNRFHPELLNSKIVMILFTAFIGFNIFNAKQKLVERYEGWMNDYTKTSSLYSITPTLRKLGITSSDKVISIPDMSHASLYLMNQPGWTEYTDEHFNTGEKTRYNQDKKGIESSIQNGAKFLIINGIDQLYLKPYLQEFGRYLLGNHQDALIFDLTKPDTNFRLSQRAIKSHYFCSADSLTQNGDLFASTNAEFGNGKTQSSDFAQSGKNSIKLESISAYGMTLQIPMVHQGESFQINYWAKSSNPKSSGLVISSSPNSFYYTETTVIETNSTQWQIHEMNFFIPFPIHNQELKIYFFNPEKEPAYFDDLEIIWFESFLNVPPKPTI